ncbi:nucleotide-binding protein [Arenibaculum pallidiluteum]|uniref:nucleotide-binding protein n=1 Tax=Arenibaculum pallidiluteum TaxID=2812559 RepID=UPI001A97AA19|nr:hypothetical protein [Arenibaculum pallidiluteum]
MDGIMDLRATSLDLGRGERLPCAAFLSESASAAVAGRAMAARGWPVAAAEGGLDAAATALSSGRTPAVLLLDLDGVAEPLAALERLADLCEPGTRVIAVGSANDVALFRSLLAAGIDDYLTKPLAEPALAEALRRASERPAPAAAPVPAADAAGRAVVVVGVRGGVGASSLAASLAALRAGEGRPTVLVDLDLQFGAAALAFDVEPGRGLLEALANPERVDELFLQRAAVKLPDGLSILCAEEGPERRLPARQEGTALVMERLRAGFETLILDLPRWTVADLPPLDARDQVVLVTDYTLRGLRDCVRLARHFRGLASAPQILVVASPVGDPARTEVARADVEKAVGVPVSVEMPFDPKLFTAAGRNGRPAFAAGPRSGTAAAVRRLGALLFPGTAPPVPLWRRVLARGR